MSVTRRAPIGIFVACMLALAPKAAADEGGVSFWVPGFLDTLAAAPLQPGWSFTAIYYHTSVSAGADVAFARQVSRGNITVPFTGNLNASIKGDADLGMALPNYVFTEKVLGGQAQVGLVVPFGFSKAAVDATLTGAVGPIGFTLSGGRADEVTGFGDLAPLATLRWNDGVHNYMTYVLANLTVGRYQQQRLANLGIGHNALDAGGAYTYFNPQTGNELSGVLGFTYNFENTHTQYQNGIDMHFDWSASHFLTKQLQIGLVGYAYKQLSCDSGAGDRVGCFESQVFGVGPQIGFIIPIDKDYQGYLSLKGFKEFAAEHRPDGWNVWLSMSISPAAKQEQSAKPVVTKY